MRKIKFRVWDEKIGRMCEFGLIGATAYASLGLPIMQYTGLKDRNGKEIYEGDIWERDQYIAVVRFEFCKWSLKHPEGAKVISYPYFYSNAESGEVIGNIYENPELLETDNE